MQEYVMAVVNIDGKPARLIHKKNCKKLDKIEMPYKLGSHPTMNRALEKASWTFNEVRLCPICCVDDTLN